MNWSFTKKVHMEHRIHLDQGRCLVWPRCSRKALAASRPVPADHGELGCTGDSQHVDTTCLHPFLCSMSSKNIIPVQHLRAQDTSI